MDSKDTEAVSTISKTIIKAFRGMVNNIPYDVTKRGHIIKIINGDFYIVKIQGTNYKAPCSTDQSFNVGDAVFITFPQNNKSDGFITGKAKR